MQTQEISKAVQYRRLSTGGTRAVILITFLQILASYLLYSLGPLGPFLKTTFALSYSQLGSLNAVFFSSMILGSIPAGIIVDWWGSRFVLFLGQILTIICFSTLISFAPNYYVYLIGMLIAGLTYSSFQPSTNKMIILNVDKEIMPAALGFKQMGVGFGAVLAGLLLPFIANLYSWRHALLISNLFILPLSLILLYYLRNNRETEGLKNSSGGFAAFRQGIQEVLKNRRLILLLIIGILLDGNQFALNTYMTTWLTETKGLSFTAAGSYYALVQVSGTIGRFALPLVCFLRLKGHQQKGLFITSILSIFAISMLMLVKTGGVPLIGLMLLIGFACFGWIGLLLGFIVEEVNQKFVGLVIGAVYALWSIGVVVAPIIFGLIVDFSDYQLAWLFLILNALIVTLIAYLLIYQVPQNSH